MDFYLASQIMVIINQSTVVHPQEIRYKQKLKTDRKTENLRSMSGQYGVLKHEPEMGSTCEFKYPTD